MKNVPNSGLGNKIGGFGHKRGSMMGQPMAPQMKSPSGGYGMMGGTSKHKLGKPPSQLQSQQFNEPQ